MGTDYEILTEKDMPYFREMVDKGQAVIIEIPEDVLMDLDIGEFEEDKEAAKITDEELLEYINRHKESFIEAAERSEQIMEKTKALEEELMGTEEVPGEEEETEREIEIMPVAPLPASIAHKNAPSDAARAERNPEKPMRNEEWKRAGGPTPMEMLDSYDKEEEEQRRLRALRLRRRMQQEENKGATEEKPQDRDKMAEAVKSSASPEGGSAQKGTKKAPPTPEQIREAKEKARKLGYTEQIPMEVLMMLLDVSAEEPEEKAPEENQDPPVRIKETSTLSVRDNPPQAITPPEREEEEEERDEEEDELDNSEDVEFLKGVEESIKRNRETPARAEEIQEEKTEKEEEIEEKEETEVPKKAPDNPYTGEDALLYQEITESGQLSEEDIRFVMSNPIPTDYKRQLFLKMLEDKLDEEGV